MPVQVLGAAAPSVVDVLPVGTIDRVTSPYADDHVRHGIRKCSTKTAQFVYMLCNLLIINGHIMVEAAGVEPASENVTGQEPTCVVQFMPQALPWDVRGARSERTRNANR